MENTQQQPPRKILKVYTIVEKPGLAKGIWLEIGVASENRDGSYQAKLDALPVNGAIHIREYDSNRNKGNRKNNDQTPPREWQ